MSRIHFKPIAKWLGHESGTGLIDKFTDTSPPTTSAAWHRK